MYDKKIENDTTNACKTTVEIRANANFPANNGPGGTDRPINHSSVRYSLSPANSIAPHPAAYITVKDCANPNVAEKFGHGSIIAKRTCNDTHNARQLNHKIRWVRYSFHTIRPKGVANLLIVI